MAFEVARCSVGLVNLGAWIAMHTLSLESVSGRMNGSTTQTQNTLLGERRANLQVEIQRVDRQFLYDWRTVVDI